ncbi:hypothetical protein EXN66_Car018353 [Channa argus]|uniref:Uncharacterized protein n=1 Tax=Channa argus TaxID=215402 RepID=A0A6G1QJE0_CHAAH|nr:hypothetical protein EXN66_Car018353 [Channa argus]
MFQKHMKEKRKKKPAISKQNWSSVLCQNSLDIHSFFGMAYSAAVTSLPRL